MKSNQPSPVWPYLGILVGLFAIAVSAPRGWETLARRESIQSFLDRHPAQPTGQAQSDTAAVSSSPEAVGSVDLATGGVPSFAVSLPQSDGPFASEALSSDSSAEDGSSPSGDENQSASSELVDAQNPPAAPPRLPRPERLFAELQRLASVARLSGWATAVRQSLEELCAADDADASQTGPRPIAVVLKDLRKMGRQAEPLAKTLRDAPLEAQLLRAQYALMRRVEIWEAASQLPAGSNYAPPQSPADEQTFAEVLEQAGRRVRERPNSVQWREYLLLDRVASLAQRNYADSPTLYALVKPIDISERSINAETPNPIRQRNEQLAAERRQVARQLLDRLAAARQSREQRRYVEAAPIVALQDQLHSWAAEPVDPQTLLADLERYEQTDTSADARRLADDCRYLSWSPRSAERRLAALVDQHYRNANVRLAVAGTLLNRLVPQPMAQTAPVRDTIVGADVMGLSTTQTHLTVRLVPDPQRLRLGLEAHGVVNSNTAATSGPATFYNNGESQFVVRKLFLLDGRRLNVFPAIAEAENTRSNLVSLETDYDGVPLVGSMVRNIARSQHEERQDEARWETEQKVATRARDQLDGEITKAVDKMTTRFDQQVWEVLARLNLDLQPLALSTTEDRAVMRLRLAAPEQLGAYTPRPRAPSDSLMSLQVHESALNNTLSRLGLDGQTFTLPELFAHLRQRLNRPPADTSDADLPEDVIVTFAPEDAVRVSCQEGRVQVRIALAELREGRHRWRDFAVVTHYRPDTSTLDIHFVRDGTIFLEGESLKGKPQITLRTIFSKVLSPQRGWGLLSPEVATDPRFEDVTISQFTVDEGWIGLAYALRPTTGPIARKPK